MKPSHLFFLLVASLLLGAWGCSPAYYAPTSHHVPLLREKGEAGAKVLLGADMLEVQGSLAPAEHLGLMVNAAGVLVSDNDHGNGGSGFQAEAGAGYFRRLGDHFVFETYGLLGLGALENHFPGDSTPDPAGNLQTRYLKFGVQPALGLRSEFFDAVFSLRLAGLGYGKTTGNLVYEGADQVQYLRDAPVMLLAEPALTLRAGFRAVKLQAQMSTSFNLTRPEFPQKSTGGPFSPSGLYASLGLSFLLEK